MDMQHINLRIVFGFLLSCVAFEIFAETKIPANIQSQIPIGWHKIAYAVGDLNEDNVADHAIVIEQNDIKYNETRRFSFVFDFPFFDVEKQYVIDSFAAKRTMLVFWGVKNGKPKQVFNHTNWIDRADFGGMMGDSFDGIKINRGSILISAYGGSRETWDHTLRVRYQQNNWRMIGATYSMTDRITTDGETVDINLLNFKANKKTYKNGFLTKDVWYKLPKSKPIILK